jgi:hypothetical protein
MALNSHCQMMVLVGLVLALSACGSGGGGDSGADPDPAGGLESETLPLVNEAVYRPHSMITWHWQLQGVPVAYPGVELYDLDLFDTTASRIAELQASGARVICYFSGGSFENWRPDAANFPQGVLGKPLDGWAGERWLDIRSPAVAEIMKARLDIAVSKGCDGVEPDNVDGYANGSGFPLKSRDQFEFNIVLANAARERGLAVGLKNDLDQVASLVDYFDFAVNEQCFEYDECDLLQPFVDNGKPVLNAEYEPALRQNSSRRQALCAEANNSGFSTLILPLDLDGSFRYSCQ